MAHLRPPFSPENPGLVPLKEDDKLFLAPKKALPAKDNANCYTMKLIILKIPYGRKYIWRIKHNPNLLE